MSKDLYVKHIASEVTEEELRKLFAVCGKVTYVHMVKDAKSGQFLGCAYVKMSSEAEAKDARVTLDGARLGNREIVVVEALPQRPAGAPKRQTPAARGSAPAPGAARRPGGDRPPQEQREQRRPPGANAGKGPKRPAGGNRGGFGPKGNSGNRGR